MVVSGSKGGGDLTIEVSSDKGRWLYAWDRSESTVEIGHLTPVDVAAYTVKVVDRSGVGLSGIPVNFARVGHQVRIVVTDQRGLASVWMPDESQCQVSVAGVTHTSDAMLLQGNVRAELRARPVCRVEVVNGTSRAFSGRIELGQSEGSVANTVYLLPGGIQEFRFVRPGPININLIEVDATGHRLASRNVIVVADPDEVARHVIQD